MKLRESKLKPKKKEMKQTNRKKENEKMSLKKKEKLEWRPEDCARTDGIWSKSTGGAVNRKFHYEKFEFHGQDYGLEESVVLTPEKGTQRSYIAIIKDIYRQGKEKDLQLEVEWFYRPEDIEQSFVENLEPIDLGDLFYSFHRDEVSAESVIRKCDVYFVPDDKELIQNHAACLEFIVRRVYDHVEKNLTKLLYSGFSSQQKDQISLLVEKTTSRLDDLFPIHKEKTALTMDRRKKLVPKRHIPVRITGARDARVNLDTVETSRELSGGSIWRDFETGEASNAIPSESAWRNFHIEGVLRSFSSDLDRGKSLEELLKAVKDTNEEKQAGDYDVVQTLEHELYQGLADNVPMYNYKVKNLVDTLKNSPVFCRRLLNGNLKPKQAIKMTHFERTRGFTFDEIKAGFEEPALGDTVASTSATVASTSATVGPKD